MRYRQLVEEARSRGVASEAKMWESISAVDELLDEVCDDEAVCRFMTRVHEIMYGCHFDEQFYEKLMDDISFTDRDGARRKGAHWSVAEVETAMRGLAFGNEVTKYDKAAAANIIYSDLCGVLDDGQVIKAAHKFFFCDEDWPHKNEKVWQYAAARRYYESR